MRELLLFVAPVHEAQDHSVATADIGSTVVILRCSCGAGFNLFEDSWKHGSWDGLKRRIKDVRPWK